MCRGPCGLVMSFSVHGWLRRVDRVQKRIEEVYPTKRAPQVRTLTLLIIRCPFLYLPWVWCHSALPRIVFLPSDWTLRHRTSSSRPTVLQDLLRLWRRVSLLYVAPSTEADELLRRRYDEPPVSMAMGRASGQRERGTPPGRDMAEARTKQGGWFWDLGGVEVELRGKV